ncbi:MAG: YihY/virulence factor BrkB family protein [Bacteroidota bacterium]
MSKVAKKLKEHRALRALKNLTKKITLPGFEGISLHDVGLFFIKGIQHGDILSRASAVAFSFFLALFPSIIFLFTLIPYIPIDNFQSRLFEMLRHLMSESAFEAARETITEIITQPNSGLLSFGFVLALYFSTNGFNAMIGAFNRSYHIIETRNWFWQRLISLILVFIMTLLLILAIGIIVLSEKMIHLIFSDGFLETWLIVVGRWLVLFVLCFSTISFIYYLGPSKKNRWKFFSAGSMFATLLSILTSIGFSYYVNNFGSYNKLYGSIGTLIVIQMWIYFNCLVMILGFELNASIHVAKNRKGTEIDFQKLDRAQGE